MNLKPTVAFVAISLIWGSMWLTQQTLSGSVDPLPLWAIVYGLCAATLAVIGFVFRLPIGKECVTSAVLGVSLIALPLLFTIWSANQLSFGLVAILVATTPLVTGFLCDGSWSARNAAIAGLGGIVLVVADIVSPTFSVLPWALLVFAGVAATSGSLVIAKRRLTKSHPVYIAAIQLAVASAVLGLVYFAKPVQSAPEIPHEHLPWMLILCATAGNIIAYPLYFWLLQRIGPDQLASTVWAQLLVSVGESVFLLRPHVGWRIFLGAAIVIASLITLARSQLEGNLVTVKVTPLPR
jgi:drug/metabolite transporter (DMT)-like permease